MVPIHDNGKGNESNKIFTHTHTNRQKPGDGLEWCRYYTAYSTNTSGQLEISISNQINGYDKFQMVNNDKNHCNNILWLNLCHKMYLVLTFFPFTSVLPLWAKFSSTKPFRFPLFNSNTFYLLLWRPTYISSHSDTKG